MCVWVHSHVCVLPASRYVIHNQGNLFFAFLNWLLIRRWVDWKCWLLPLEDTFHDHPISVDFFCYYSFTASISLPSNYHNLSFVSRYLLLYCLLLPTEYKLLMGRDSFLFCVFIIFSARPRHISSLTLGPQGIVTECCRKTMIFPWAFWDPISLSDCILTFERVRDLMRFNGI